MRAPRTLLENEIRRNKPSPREVCHERRLHLAALERPTRALDLDLDRLAGGGSGLRRVGGAGLGLILHCRVRGLILRGGSGDGGARSGAG